MSSTEPKNETMDREDQQPHTTKVAEELADKKPVDEAKEFVGEQVEGSKSMWKACCDTFFCCCACCDDLTDEPDEKQDKK